MNGVCRRCRKVVCDTHQKPHVTVETLCSACIAVEEDRKVLEEAARKMQVKAYVRVEVQDGKLVYLAKGARKGSQ